MNRGTKSSGGSMHAMLSTPRSITTDVVDAAEHRRKLEALFGGSIAPVREQTPHVARSFAAPPQRRLGRGRLSDRSMLLNLTRELMREAIANNDSEAFERGAEKFLSSHELPDDADFLCKMLHHPSERVLCNVLGHISGLLLQKRLMSSLPLVEMAVADLGRRIDIQDSVRCCVQGLLAQIARLRPN